MTEQKIPIHIALNLNRALVAFILASFLMGMIVPRLDSEPLTASFFYPAPLGVYQGVVTTGGNASAPANTILARDAGNVLIGANRAAVQVGIGTASPASALSVAGSVQLGDDASACSAAKAGSLRYHAGQLQMCSSGAWIAYSASSTPTLYAPTNFITCSVFNSGSYRWVSCYGPRLSEVATSGPVYITQGSSSQLGILATVPGSQCSWSVASTLTGALSPTTVYQCL